MSAWSTIKGLLWTALLVVTICKYSETVCPDPNDVEVCKDNEPSKCFCRACLSCPEGYGQNYECASRIKTSQKLKCVPCVVGANYSDTKSSALCRPCGGCDGFKVLHNCTITKPTICSLDSCADGYDFNSDMPDMLVCQKKPTQPPTQPPTTLPPTTLPPTTQPPTTLPPTTLPPTTQQPKTLPPTTQQPKTLPPTTLPPTTQQPTTLPPTTLPPTTLPPTTQPRAQKAKSTDSDRTTPTTNSGTLQKATMNDPKKSSTKHQASTSSHNKVILIVVITILVIVLALFIIAAILVFLKRKKIYKYFRKAIKSKDGSSSPESWPLNAVASRQAYPWPENLLLKSIPHELRSAIETRISNPKQPGWRELAQELGLDEETILGIDNHNQPEKGYHLFEALKTQKTCKLSFTAFANALAKLKRVDVVEMSKDYYRDNDVNNVTLEDS